MRTIIAVALLVAVGGFLFLSNNTGISVPGVSTSSPQSSALSSVSELWSKIRNSFSTFFGEKETTSLGNQEEAKVLPPPPPPPVAVVKDPPPEVAGLTKVVIGDTEVLVEVVDTPASRERGLSGRTSLPEGRGMLFVFDTPARYGIWMKDMNFPIDIVWITSSFKVNHIESSVSPSTYPTVFRSPEPARYVLEVPSGFMSGHGVKVGATVRIIEE